MLGVEPEDAEDVACTVEDMEVTGAVFGSEGIGKGDKGTRNEMMEGHCPWVKAAQGCADPAVLYEVSDLENSWRPLKITALFVPGPASPTSATEAPTRSTALDGHLTSQPEMVPSGKAELSSSVYVPLSLVVFTQ
jgi:hypothetical protein